MDDTSMNLSTAQMGDKANGPGGGPLAPAMGGGQPPIPGSPAEFTFRAKNLLVPEPKTARLLWRGDDGQEITYDATASHTDVVADDGSLICKMFSVAYVAVNGVPNAKDARAASSDRFMGFSGRGATPDAGDWFAHTRPVTFCWNGGPGCSSIPLDFGGIGPIRVETEGLDHLLSPGDLTNNPGTILPFTDLVFFDAPGTGWSPIAPDYDKKKVWSVDGDADAFCRAITAWLTEHKRWNSPVFLYGESYGTMRNPVLARLMGEKNVGLAGVVEQSSLMDWTQCLPGQLVYYLGMVPSYCAVAQWFGKAGEGVDPNEWFYKACDWVNEKLAVALVLGDQIAPERESELAEELSQMMGVSADFLRERHLMIELDDFRKELLKDEGKVLARYDLRFTADQLPAVQGSSDFFAGEDASSDALQTAWLGAFRSLMDRLDYVYNMPYVMTNFKANETWNWTHQGPGVAEPSQSANVLYDLNMALHRNPRMHVCFIGGRYDAATPFWNILRDVNSIWIPKDLKDHIEWHLHGCGHMAYDNIETMKAMAADLKEFYAKAAKE